MDSGYFKPGDEVALISDDSVTYIILSVYGNGFTICSFMDKKTKKPHELSIPLVALTKTNSAHGNNRA